MRWSHLALAWPLTPSQVNNFILILTASIGSSLIISGANIAEVSLLPSLSGWGVLYILQHGNSVSHSLLASQGRAMLWWSRSTQKGRRRRRKRNPYESLCSNESGVIQSRHDFFILQGELFWWLHAIGGKLLHRLLSSGFYYLLEKLVVLETSPWMGCRGQFAGFTCVLHICRLSLGI